MIRAFTRHARLVRGPLKDWPLIPFDTLPAWEVLALVAGAGGLGFVLTVIWSVS